MKARKFRTLLERELGYTVASTKGSHRKLVSEGRPKLIFAWHDGDEIGAAMIRTILVRDVGLTLTEAKEVARRG
ncbi:hypothetical protein GCM10009789_49740 [Kribbella sancticallisti]|uniref:Type II toxin-antitoxin system HicA family toxin n=2 Tax=Kribbella sancticallisti TaxID=460087 RepID=A0ABP4PTI1_9ACTN